MKLTRITAILAVFAILSGCGESSTSSTNTLATSEPTASKPATETSAPRSATSTPAAEVTKKPSLGISPSEFKTRYNSVMARGDIAELMINNIRIIDGEVNNVAIVMLGKNLAINLSLDKHNNNEILGVMMMGQGDGTTSSGLKIMMVELAIAEVFSPELNQKVRNDMVLDLIKRAGNNKSDDMVRKTIGKVRYASMISEITGVTFTVSPVEDKADSKKRKAQ